VATKRETPYGPYGAFNFLVQFGDADSGPIDAGFSDVSGLGNEINYSEYRDGNSAFNTTSHVPNTYKCEEVTFKRGLMGVTDAHDWVKAGLNGTYKPRTITVILLDEQRNQVASFVLRNAQPKKWVGPTLAAKGGGEVAMEELHVVHEGIEYK
jgi:phage tail-like protein